MVAHHHARGMAYLDITDARLDQTLKLIVKQLCLFFITAFACVGLSDLQSFLELSNETPIELATNVVLWIFMVTAAFAGWVVENAQNMLTSSWLFTWLFYAMFEGAAVYLSCFSSWRDSDQGCRDTINFMAPYFIHVICFCLAGWWTSRSNSQSDGTLLEKGCCGVLSDEDPSKKGKDTKPHPWHSRAYKDKGKQKATLEMH